MPLTGEATAKFGMRYETLWTVLCMLDVMDHRADSIRLVPPGVEGEGVEFRIRREGIQEYHQVKRQHGAEGRWTLKELGSRTVLSAFWDKLNDPAARCVFVSGEEHCVTAHVEDAFGNPTPDITVQFSVTGIIAVEGSTVKTSESGSATTNQDGDAEFCYTSELPGENVIKAYADTDGDGTQDAGEPFDTATKTYVLPESTPNCELMMNDGGWIVAANDDKGTFGGNAKVDASGQIEKGSQEYTDHGPAALVHVKSTEILAVVCEGNNRATVWGLANVTSETVEYPSGTFFFRVRVMDSGEPSTADTYGILVGNGYYSGDERELQGGNIQIHRSG